jgi:hypothetical protein
MRRQCQQPICYGFSRTYGCSRHAAASATASMSVAWRTAPAHHRARSRALYRPRERHGCLSARHDGRPGRACGRGVELELEPRRHTPRDGRQGRARYRLEDRSRCPGESPRELRLTRHPQPKTGPAARECSVLWDCSDHGYPVTSLAWSLDDAILVTAAEQQIKLWDTRVRRLGAGHARSADGPARPARRSARSTATRRL